MSGRELLRNMKEWIKCPQFGDDHYGKQGSLKFKTREEIFRLVRYCEALQDFEDQIVPFLIDKVSIVGSPKKIGLISRKDYDLFFKNLLDIDELVIYEETDVLKFKSANEK